MLPRQSEETPGRSSPRTRRARVLLLFGVVGLAALLLAVGLTHRRERPIEVPAPPSPPPPTSSALGKGRTLVDALLARGMSRDLAARIVQALRPHMDFRRLRPEDSVELHQDVSGALIRVVGRAH